MSDELELDNIENGSGDTEPAGDKTPKNDEEVKTLQAQKEHWREKAEKLAKEKADLEAKIPKEEKSSTPSVALEDIFALEGFSKDEKEFIVKEAKAKGLSIGKAVNDEGIKFGLDGLNAKVAKEKAIPTPSGESNSADFKKVEEMTREEHIQYEKEMLAKRGGKVSV